MSLRRNQQNGKEGINRGKRDKITKKQQQQKKKTTHTQKTMNENGSIKSFLISNYFKCKWIKLPN